MPPVHHLASNFVGILQDFIYSCLGNLVFLFSLTMNIAAAFWDAIFSGPGDPGTEDPGTEDPAGPGTRGSNLAPHSIGATFCPG